MTPDQFKNHLNKVRNEMEALVQQKLPQLIGKLAVDHFKENFEKGGFVNNGLTKWTEPKRLNPDSKYAAAKYGTLLSARKELYNSISFNAGIGSVTITSDKEYAQIHNEGGVIPIASHSRLYVQNKYAKGKKKGKWKVGTINGKGPTVKAHEINMPQRQFIGQSVELNEIIVNVIEKEITKLMKL